MLIYEGILNSNHYLKHFNSEVFVTLGVFLEGYESLVEYCGGLNKNGLLRLIYLNP